MQLNDKYKIMEITTYNYNGENPVELVGENVKLSDAIKQLQDREIHFFQIRDEDSFLEITLSDKGDIITNGCELF